MITKNKIVYNPEMPHTQFSCFCFQKGSVAMSIFTPPLTRKGSNKQFHPNFSATAIPLSRDSGAIPKPTFTEDQFVVSFF